MREKETSTPTTRSSPAQDQEPGVPLFTWIIGATALVVVLTAGALFLDDSPKTKVGDETHPTEVEQLTDSPAKVSDPLATKHPLELTASYLDAQERGRLWNPSAILSGIELVIDGGHPQGAIVFEFGESIGQPIPGAPLSAKRLSLSYEGKKVSESSGESPEKRLGLAEPNCPLEVAFRKLTEAGVKTRARIGVLYTYSHKHGKPVWLVTDEQNQTTSLNADNCALLLR